MFTMCILFSTLNTKAKGICKGASKQPRPKKLYRAGNAPPGSQTPGSATEDGRVHKDKYLDTSIKRLVNTEKSCHIEYSCEISKH